MSVLTLIVDKIMPIGLALIVYKLVSVLTSIPDEIDMGKDPLWSIGHLLHTY